MARTRSVGPSLGRWLTLLLFFVAAVPSAGLLWFVNRAAQNEQLAVQQRLTDAYRAHLLLARERLDVFWRDHLQHLDTSAASENPAQLFASTIASGTADAVIIRDDDGRVLYPSALPPSLQSPVADSAERASASARATELLEHLRAAIRAQDRAAVVALVEGPLQDEMLTAARDAQGRPVLPSAELLALESLAATPRDEAAQALLDRLAARLRDYEGPEMPAAQRRFLMRALQRIEPSVEFATLEAEDLAARWLQLPAPDQTGTEGLRRSALPDIWEFRAPERLVVSLHSDEALLERMRAAITPSSLASEARLDFVAPGAEAPATFLVSVPAPSVMPGWRLGLTLLDGGQLAASSRQRATSYLWIGLLVIAVVALLGALTWGLMRRQFALTRLRNDLVANVTHELKTPLASIRLLVDTLLDAPRLEETTAREYLTLIARENLRLSRLIDNFLTFSRIERNKYTFSFSTVSPEMIVQQATAALQDRLHTPTCRFEVEMEPDLPDIRADTDALVAAVINLLDNALKYTGESKEITLTVRHDGGRVVFAVKDNGIGLSDREVRRVFRRFYRVSDASGGGRSGCGLGLSIVQFIISAHGGDVRVSSMPGKGSTFSFDLPHLASTGTTPTA